MIDWSGGNFVTGFFRANSTFALRFLVRLYSQSTESNEGALHQGTQSCLSTKVKARLCEWQTLIYNNFNLVSA